MTIIIFAVNSSNVPDILTIYQSLHFGHMVDST
jgi:hypothetical protein